MRTRQELISHIQDCISERAKTVSYPKGSNVIANLRNVCNYLNGSRGRHMFIGRLAEDAIGEEATDELIFYSALEFKVPREVSS